MPEEKEFRQPSFLDTPSAPTGESGAAPSFPQFPPRPAMNNAAPSAPATPAQMPPSQMQMPLEKPFLDEPEASSSILRTAIMLGLMVGLLALGWMAYKEASSPNPNEPVPVIKADSTPFKQAPADPGGEQIPNKDREVFNALGPVKKADAAATETSNAQPRPQPEQPINREALDAIATMENNNAPEAKNPLEQPVVKQAPEAKPVAEKSPEKSEKPAIETTPEVKKAAATTEKTAEKKAVVEKVEKVEKTEASVEKPLPVPASVQQLRADEMTASAPAANASVTAAEPVKTQQQVANVAEVVKESTAKPASMAKPKPATAKIDSSTAKGSIMVQLGAVKSEGEASAEWKRLQKRFVSELGSLRYSTQRVDLGGKGVFYRIQAGPLSNHEAAKALCSKLTAKKQGCIIVR